MNNHNVNIDIALCLGEGVNVYDYIAVLLADAEDFAINTVETHKEEQ
jgi:hypothetical protein